MSEGSIDAYWCLWVPAGVCGCLLVSEGTNRYLRVPTGVLGFLLVPEMAYWCLWVATGVCG